jgi:hypothetical protein
VQNGINVPKVSNWKDKWYAPTNGVNSSCQIDLFIDSQFSDESLGFCGSVTPATIA